jgi:hypothetical protein
MYDVKQPDISGAIDRSTTVRSEQVTAGAYGAGRNGARGRVMRRAAPRLRSRKKVSSRSAERGGLIKVGQILSTRVDLLPPEWTAGLSGLQDRVAPSPWSGADEEVAGVGLALEHAVHVHHVDPRREEPLEELRAIELGIVEDRGLGDLRPLEPRRADRSRRAS